MAHGADGGAPPCGCWNACKGRVDGSLAYRCAALTTGQAGRCGWFGRPEPVSDVVGDTGFEPVTSSV